MISICSNHDLCLLRCSSDVKQSITQMNITGMEQQWECVKLTLVVSVDHIHSLSRRHGNYLHLVSIVTVVPTIITLHTYGHFPIKFWTIISLQYYNARKYNQFMVSVWN